MSELQKRILTAIIGVSLLLGCISFGGVWGAWFVGLVVALGMIAEYANITFALPDRTEKRAVLLSASFFLAFAYGFAPQTIVFYSVALFLSIFSYFLFSARRYEGATLLSHCQELMYAVFGLIYVSLLPLFLVAIRRERHGRDWIILFFLIVWAGDTVAYFVGKKFGRRKLYPKISPKKTIEGAVGGIVGSVVISELFRSTNMTHLGFISVTFLAVSVCVVSQVGDLCESLLKRAFDKKDSGSILPGHGGFLDRFDSVVFSLPIMYAWVRFLS